MSLIPLFQKQLDTGHKLNGDKTFRRRPGRFIYAQFASSIQGKRPNIFIFVFADVFLPLH